MTKLLIEKENTRAIDELMDIIAQHSDGEMDTPLAKGKWSMREQAEHMIMTIGGILKGANLPSKKLTAKFGKVDQGHQYRTYDQIKMIYHKALSTGITLPEAFSPKSDNTATKGELLHEIDTLKKSIAPTLQKWSDAELDSFQLPHPLIGMLTLREFLTFNVLHVDHHIVSIKKYLEAKDSSRKDSDLLPQ